LFPACAAVGTTIICGGPFNSGVLVGREMWNYAKAPHDVVERVDKLKSIAEAHSVPLPAAALQFPLASSTVSSVIPGSRSREEFAGILAWAQFEIPAEFWTELRAENLLHPNAPTPVDNPYS